MAILLVSLGACTSPVEADSLEYAAEPEPSLRVLMRPDAAELESEPEAKPEPEPEPEPEPNAKFPSLRLDFETWAQHGLCGVDVAALGLPAIRNDGDAVAYLQRTPPGGADGPLPSWLVIEEGDQVRRLPVFEDGAWEACEGQVERLKGRVAKLNRTLKGYRPLPELDVVGDTPAHVFFEYDEDPIEQEIRALPGAQRPVRATYGGGRFALRVPGVEVVHTVETNWWRDDEYCNRTPAVRRVLADRSSGTAVVTIDYINGACLCEDGVYSRVVTLPPEVFEAVDARPTRVIETRLDVY